MPKRRDSVIPNDLPAEGVCSMLGVKAESGLTKAEAARRRRREGPNKIYDDRRTSVLRYISFCSFDLLLILLLLTALTAAVFEEKLAYAVIVPTLILSIILRTAAYIAARRYLEACSSAEAVMPGVEVLRGGVTRRMDARFVVRGDILRLRAGDIVPADCRIITSDMLSVYEEQTTGVAGAVKKEADSVSGASLVSRANTLYAGSSVLSGECTAVVTHIGVDTLVVRTRGYFKTTRGGTLKLSRLLDSYSRKWGALMALLAFAVTVLDLFVGGRGLFEVFFLGLSLAAATMCEYYSAIGDIAAACGLSALGRTEGVALRGVKAIETLSELDTVIIPSEGVIVTDGVECGTFFYDGGITDIGVAADDADAESADVPDELLRYAAMTTRLVSGDGHVYSEETNTLGDYLSYIEYDSDTVYGEGESPVMFGGVGDGLSFDTLLLSYGDSYMSVSSGGARAITDACAFVRAHGATAELTDDVKAGINNFIAYHERRGAVAVAVARKKTPFHSKDRLPFTQFDMELYGIMMLYRPLADGAAEAAQACGRAGIRVIMTGDGSEAAKLADRAGIISGRDDIITGREFAAASASERKNIAGRARLLLGFDARQMKDFIKSAGDRVAYVASDSRDMIGELSALSSVGAGFALLSAEGGESRGAVRMRADTVVPRAERDGGGLSAIAASVAFAKHIYTNISHIADYLLTSQAARIFTVLCTVISKSTAILPQQILIWGLIFDFFAVIVLATERPCEETLAEKPDVYERLSHPVSRLGKTALLGLLWSVPTMLTPLLHSGDMRASITFVSVLLSIVVVCGEYRSDYPVFSRRRNHSTAVFLLAGAAAALIIAVTVSPVFASALALKQPDEIALALSLIPAAVQLAFYEAARFIFRRKQKSIQ